MSIVSAAALFPRDVPTSLFGSFDAGSASTNPFQAPSEHHGHHHGRATRVDLSDKVKDILARAGSDQDAADRLKAFLAAHRRGGSVQDNSSSDSSTDINEAFKRLTQGAPTTDGSQDPESAQDGTTSAFSASSSYEANVAVQAYRRGSKEYITLSESEIAATSVNTSSGAGTVSATSTGTHTQSVTFAIDFRTGAVSVSQSEYLSVSTAVQIAQTNPSFSAFA